MATKMAAYRFRLPYFKLFEKCRILKNSDRLYKFDYCTSSSKEDESADKVNNFVSFFEKQSQFLNKSESKEPKAVETFEYLLRNSKFIDLGDPVNKQVIGTIFHTVEEDLYIDFGWKFYTVCPKPKKNSQLYIKGAKVRLLIKDLELSTRFLGSTTDITLKEADCVLLGLIKS